MKCLIAEALGIASGGVPGQHPAAEHHCRLVGGTLHRSLALLMAQVLCSPRISSWQSSAVVAGPAAMAPGGGWDEAVAKNLEAGFYNHCFCNRPGRAGYCFGKCAKASVLSSFRSSSMAPMA